MSFRVEHLAEGVSLYLGDCREVLPTLGRFDAVVTDPPYGIGFRHGGNDNSGIGRGKYATKFAGVAVAGDDEPFDPAHLLAASPVVVLWGANHYADKLPPSPSWLIWDKRAASQHTNDFADCELAWTNTGGVARVFRHQWDGMMKASERGEPRVHPTQKPVALMDWAIEAVTVRGQTICDPYMGSGTTGVSAARLGRSFVGIELDSGHFETACRRVSDALKQPDFFIEKPKPLKQEVML